MPRKSDLSLPNRDRLTRDDACRLPLGNVDEDDFINYYTRLLANGFYPVVQVWPPRDRNTGYLSLVLSHLAVYDPERDLYWDSPQLVDNVHVARFCRGSKRLLKVLRTLVERSEALYLAQERPSEKPAQSTGLQPREARSVVLS